MAGPDPYQVDIDPLKQLREVMGLLRRGWFTLFTLISLGLLIGLALFFFLPQQFVSSAKIMLRANWMFEQPNEAGAQARQPLSVRSRLLEDELKSTLWLEAVLDRLEWPEWAKAKGEGQDLAFLGRVKAGFTVQVQTGETGERLVFLEFSWPDRIQSRDFTEAICDHWTSETTESFEEFLQATLAAKEEALREKGQQLTKALEARQHFEETSGITNAYRMDQSVARRNELEKQLDSLAGQIAGESARHDEVERLLQERDENGNLRYPPTITEVQTVENKAKKATLEDIERYVEELKELREVRTLTDKHYEVIAKKDQLERAVASLDDDEVPDELKIAGLEVENPSYKQHRDDLHESHLKLTSLRAQQTNQSQELELVEQRLKTLPGMLRRLDELQAEITTHQKIVEVAKIELQQPKDLQREMRQLGLNSKKAYQYLDRPRAAPDSEATIGWIALAASLILGLALSVAIIFGRELLKTSLSNADQARRMLRLPVLGEVAPIQTEVEARRARLQRSLQLAASLTLLLGLGASIYVCVAHSELLPTGLVEWAADVRGGLG